MNSIKNQEKPTGAERGNWLKRNYVSLLILSLVLALVATLYVFYQRNPDKVAAFESYGYLGSFLISLVTNATVILPFPGVVVLFALGAAFNPFFIGLSAGIGGTIGEMTAYLLGYSGRGVVANRRFYDTAVQWLEKWGVLTVFVFALTPLPFDVLGIAAGLLRFPFWKFFVACWLGKTILYIGMAFVGAWGWEAFVSGGLSLASPISAGTLAALGALLLLALALIIENWTWKRGR